MINAIKLLGQYSTWVVTNDIRVNPDPMEDSTAVQLEVQRLWRGRKDLGVVHHVSIKRFCSVSANVLLTRIVSLQNPMRTSDN